MLKTPVPFLCQECHTGRHPASAYSGANLPPTANCNPANPATFGGNCGNSSRLIGSGCANCHSKVHGSNHPSGTFFTR
jgi:hypothetical protein